MTVVGGDPKDARILKRGMRPLSDLPSSALRNTVTSMAQWPIVASSSRLARETRWLPLSESPSVENG